MRCLLMASVICLVGCHSIKNKTTEETFYYLGCPKKLLPVNRAVVMHISKDFWTQTDKKVWNSFSKEEWCDMMRLLARIPTDCIYERGRIVDGAYHLVYDTEGKPAGVTISLFLGEQIPLVRSKDGQWRILNVEIQCCAGAPISKPVVNGKWTSQQVVGVWRGIDDRKAFCEFVFFADGTGSASEAFSFTSLGAKKRLEHQLVWTTDAEGSLLGILVSMVREDNKNEIRFMRLHLEEKQGETNAVIETITEDRIDAKIWKVSSNPNSHSDGSGIRPAGEIAYSLATNQYVGAWAGVTKTWPTNYSFKFVLNANGTGLLKEGFSKTACDFSSVIEHKLFWTVDEKGQCVGVTVAVVKGKGLDVYTFSLEKKEGVFLFYLQKQYSDIVDVAKVWKVSSKSETKIGINAER
jgi:hypothetical protein